jgi:hypothetical protein
MLSPLGRKSDRLNGTLALANQIGMKGTNRHATMVSFDTSGCGLETFTVTCLIKGAYALLAS